jgi:hypothetical protein
MTRNEAADMIRDDIRLHHDYLSGKYRKALRMAIDVLEKLPEKHGDLIDRDVFKSDHGMKDDCSDCEKECRGETRACEYDIIYSKKDFCCWLDYADVVIEAEEGT